jgi:hypothetical protein
MRISADPRIGRSEAVRQSRAQRAPRQLGSVSMVGKAAAARSAGFQFAGARVRNWPTPPVRGGATARLLPEEHRKIDQRDRHRRAKIDRFRPSSVGVPPCLSIVAALPEVDLDLRMDNPCKRNVMILAACVWAVLRQLDRRFTVPNGCNPARSPTGMLAKPASKPFPQASQKSQ